MKNSKLQMSLLLIATLIALTAQAEIPTGYYDGCKNKSGAELLSELCNTISDHTIVSYDNLWEVYWHSDVRDDGTIWDMYSTKHWTSTDNRQVGTNIGYGLNREHSMPKSWFNSASPMYSDAFHIYPTDSKVNGQRSNWPYGECENGTTLPSYDGVDALGKLGACTFPGHTGTVFEPDDEYKGDFARTYFYMAACYNDKISTWTNSYDVFTGNAYPAYTEWVINLFLKWHRQDPVSQKELDRNEAVYGYQHNRNPFIDHPELAEYVWGDKIGKGWDEVVDLTPKFLYPTQNSTIDLGSVAINTTVSKTITVKGSNLTDAVNVRVNGTGFSANKTTLSKSLTNADGADLIISYTSAVATEATGTVTLTSGETVCTFNVTARAIDGIPVAHSDVTHNSFVVTWSNIHEPDATYTFHLWQDNEAVEGHPKDVAASDERIEVTNLIPSTTYEYQLAYNGTTSQRGQVTTGVESPYVSDGSNIEDFEQKHSINGYAGGTYNGKQYSWLLTNTMMNGAQYSHNSNSSARLGKSDSDASVEMQSNATQGIGTVKYWGMKWSNDNDATAHVQYSTNDGTDWQDASVTPTHTFTNSTEWEQATATVNQPGSVRLRIIKNKGEGGRLHIDDIEFTNFVMTDVEECVMVDWRVIGGYGQIQIESDINRAYAVYNIYGGVCYTGTLQGSIVLDLAPGLYIVLCDNTATKILVK